MSSQSNTSASELNNGIDECKLSKKPSSKNKDQYSHLVDNSMVGVFNSHVNGQLIFVNKALSQMFDFDTPEQVIDKMSLDYWKDPKQREQYLIELHKYGHISNFEAEGITNSGRHIHILISATLHADQISGMVMDITDKKHAERKNLLYQQRLKTLASQLIIAEEKERQHIAMGLHDNIGQSLVFFRIQLNSLRQQVATDEAIKLIDELSHSFLNMIQDIKELVFELSSPLLNEIGLSSAISQFLNEQIGQKYDLEVEFIDHCQTEPENNELRIIIFRNVRELLINVVKHAQAKKIIVSIEQYEDNFIITIQDDGRGFMIDNNIKTEIPVTGFGLFSIHERMQDMGGSLILKTEPGKGCKAILTTPLA